MIQRSYRRAACAMLLACSALCAAPVAAQQPATSAPQQVHFGTWGVDISTRDLTVKPGDDFQRYAAGKWLDTHEIPADKSQNGIGSELADRNQEQLRAIVMSAPEGQPARRLLRELHGRGAAGAARRRAAEGRPRQGRCDQDQGRVHALHGASRTASIGQTLFGVGVLPDFAQPDMNIGGVFSSGMGMPDRDYYLTRQVQDRSATPIARTCERTLEMIGDAECRRRRPTR